MQSGPEDIAAAVTQLRSGGLVAFPTETVYGLGALALDAHAVAEVFRVKGRPETNPLIVHVVDDVMAQRVCAEWPRVAARLAAEFWPGPLTLVLPKAADLPGIVTANGPTVAVRSPSHPLTLALLEALGEPLVGPSANRSGRVSPTCAAHVRESFPDDTVLVLDGGPCVGGIESTVVDVTCEPLCVLRPGLISAAQIAAAIGRDVVSGEPHSDTTDTPPPPARTPGHIGTHYAPVAPARLVNSAELDRALRALSKGEHAAVLTAQAARVQPPHRAIEMPRDARAYAARLYAALREADAMMPSIVLIERPWPNETPTAPPTGVWAAVADRLTRATAQTP